MTIKELAINCENMSPYVCGDKCPYRTECKEFQKIVEATIIPQSLIELLKYIDNNFLMREL